MKLLLKSFEVIFDLSCKKRRAQQRIDPHQIPAGQTALTQDYGGGGNVLVNGIVQPSANKSLNRTATVPRSVTLLAIRLK